MTDFLRENSWCDVETYKWGMTVGQIRLMKWDYTHVEYLDAKRAGEERRMIRIDSAEDLRNLNDLGFPILKRIKNNNDNGKKQ